jgi:hypothetical protein
LSGASVVKQKQARVYAQPKGKGKVIAKEVEEQSKGKGKASVKKVEEQSKGKGKAIAKKVEKQSKAVGTVKTDSKVFVLVLFLCVT